MQRAVDDHDTSPVMIAVMGMTGTGKSTFIHLLTGDDRIHIGHTLSSDTSTIQTAQYVDKKTGRTVILIDTPGFDDSRGVTDTDILKMISRMLGPEGGPRPKLNGLIYMHRISDPRVGGTSRKNLRMFHSLCGDENLANVRIITTNWSRVSEQEGKDRAEALGNEAFKLLLDAGAKMLRHDNNIGSAENIMSELIPLPQITTQFERELEAGKKLTETAAGSVLTEEITKIQEKHAKELADLQKDMQDALKENDRAWREEIEQERRELQEKMARVENERKELEKRVGELQVDVQKLKSKSDGPSCIIM